MVEESEYNEVGGEVKEGGWRMRVANLPLIGRIFAEEKTESVLKETICAAIDARRVIEFYYQGGNRLVEPFCSGVMTPGFNEMLLCYQVGGYCEFDKPLGWKLYRIADISSLEVTDVTFSGVRPGYDPDNLAMEFIYCCVPLMEQEAIPVPPSTGAVEEHLPSCAIDPEQTVEV